MKRILLDLNVVLDVLLSRSPWQVEARAIWNANREGRIAAAVSAITLPTVFYVVRKQADLGRAHLAVMNCLQSLTIIGVDRSVLEMAANLSGSDFEDNVQIACASVAALDAVVTRDPKGFTESPVPTLSPAEFLAQLPKANGS